MSQRKATMYGRNPLAKFLTFGSLAEKILISVLYCLSAETVLKVMSNAVSVGAVELALNKL